MKREGGAAGEGVGKALRGRDAETESEGFEAPGRVSGHEVCARCE